MRQGNMEGNMVIKISFKFMTKLYYVSTDLTQRGVGVQRVTATTEKTLVPMLASTLGTRSLSELDDRRCLGFLSSGCEYAACLYENA